MLFVRGLALPLAPRKSSSDADSSHRQRNPNRLIEHKRKRWLGWWLLQKCMPRHWQFALAALRFVRPCAHKILITLQEYHSALHSWNYWVQSNPSPLWLKLEKTLVHQYIVWIVTNLWVCASSLGKGTTIMFTDEKQRDLSQDLGCVTRCLYITVTVWLCSKLGWPTGTWLVILWGRTPPGVPSSLHVLWREVQVVWQLNFKSWGLKEMIRLLSGNIQEHTESQGLNGSKPRNQVLVQCFCNTDDMILIQKGKLSLLRDLVQKNPMGDSYLVCNQEWNARDEPKALMGRTKWCISFLWLSLPLTAMAYLLCLVTNYVKAFIFFLISKHLSNEKRGK